MTISELLSVILLGIVEGITEFLPISSTGHLIVASALLNFQTNLGETFEIFIQLGAIMAVIAFYRQDLATQVRTVTRDRAVQRLWLMIVIAGLPAAVIGLLLHDWITDTLFNPTVVAISFIVGGIVFLLIERRLPNPIDEPDEPQQEIRQITLRQAVLIGLAQTVALIPGVSRSGASIIGGLLGGLTRSGATAFSFYLAIPVLGGATILDLLTNLDNVQPIDLVYLAIGTVVSGIVAWFAIGWLLRFVATNSFVLFGYYRIALGVLILGLVAGGVIQ
ncbi:MAG: undecaprenyl-diphosphate phosphatase [Anaerolineae bacterium]|jgi:undecaprenyl-diphosphatase|nr:undecaprenyl-diphosphate phosphatase [Anaerolineae bacterium]